MKKSNDIEQEAKRRADLTEKERRIAEEVEILEQLFSCVDADKKRLIDGLIQNAAFMKVTLLELQREINENGSMIEGQSGNGFMTIKDNPAQKSYTTMVSRYSGVITQLLSLLPSDIERGRDELLEFLAQR